MALGFKLGNVVEHGFDVLALLLQSRPALLDDLQALQQLRRFILGRVVHADQVGNLGQRQAEALAAQSHLQARPVAAVEHPVTPRTLRCNNALIFPEANGARCDAKLASEIGNGESGGGFGQLGILVDCTRVNQKKEVFSIRTRMVICTPYYQGLPMSLHYPHAHPPADGELIEVAPGIFWLRMPLPFQLNHINLWLLRDGDGWVIVDTGFPDDAVRATWTQIIEQLDGPVKRLIVTHFHPDHLGLAAWLMEKTGAPLAMTAGEFLTAHAVWNEVGGHGARFMVEQFRQHGLDAERLAKFEMRGSGYRKAVPALPEYYQRLKAGDVATVNGKKWQILIGHGHAPEHMSLYCAELGVLISGDMLLPKISTNISVFAATPNDDALGCFLHSLDGFARDMPEQTLVLPSHGLPFVGVQSRVAALHAHHEERLQALEEACEIAPQSAAELLDVLFQRALDTHQTMFAMGEAIAHLNLLEQAGRLSRTTDAQGVIRYTRRTACTAH